MTSPEPNVNSLGWFKIIQILHLQNSRCIRLVQPLGVDSKYIIKSILVNSSPGGKSEADVLRQLRHPHIVRYIGELLDGDSIHIIMDYAEGGNLSKYISQLKASKSMLPAYHVIYMWIQILMGLNYLHENHIVHGDLSSSNILLYGPYNRRVKISDFSESFCVNSKSQRSFHGSPMYWSPASVLNSKKSLADDVWALGILLYEITFLKYPYTRNSLSTYLLDKIIKYRYTEDSKSVIINNLIRLILDVNRPDCKTLMDYPSLVPFFFMLPTYLSNLSGHF